MPVPTPFIKQKEFGIYIHIPFCKQACHYCDFHFSTTLKHKSQLIVALCKEIILRKEEVAPKSVVETIYFGGGTPSVLEIAELEEILHTIYKHYKVLPEAEITLEANPDDLATDRFTSFKAIGINRLSIGIQSFFDQDLKLMNRAHNAQEARSCLQNAKKHFDNISIDLIYGIPGMDSNRWKENLHLALSLNIPHISSYALTVEPNTALSTFIKKGIIAPVEDELAQEHFEILVATMETEGYTYYEFSNFGKPGYFSRNNTAYWQGKPYLGIGPSAHSYDGHIRSWNINNNNTYIKSLDENTIPRESERLSNTDKYNEYIMTGLRTIWGVSLDKVEKDFGEKYKTYLLQQAEEHLQNHLLFLDGDTLSVTKKGKFLSDGIASDLFLINLKE
ncbi:radical SAM family heme chaperone HemW [Aquimarina sp. ERC-38]|uniref:radical SAM family heme chaperone HemW n=1 Tax=Aquimarina sp. ERC-38 TaxID=2949996 RepID=UPI0022477151|nr:radical SAM family heme chaperone HemW [Aquimarina sp. ERC-38]UZO81557.1 radical SAM family heme chaperone HemW [Aquimarina sp. ERC-38]